MSLRRMTSGELILARSIFENTIDYNKVWIHNEKYLPGQGERTAMTPNGEMYYPDAVYSSDFSSQSMPGERETVAGASHLFIHEMMHVWQYQKGYAVKLRGLFSWAANYHYDLNLQSIASYSMEQQASIVADLANVNYVGDTTESVNTLSEKYKKVLNLFPAGVI
ncbi:TPA: type IV secretion protein Rhs [Escherichia coli]|nr:type IV secretion protein Rhs [Escherichia coli]EIZ3557200.1 type IV secretion protein Rhs [Escherichia coli]MBB8584644.1 type IV secretion protein Rhs [Escherichia coli]HBA8817265.1 type IV secretion protein Rhs [Escherichia coli]HBA9495204.1 type IV secretion protein Rhs [Escherichia coli]